MMQRSPGGQLWTHQASSCTPLPMNFFICILKSFVFVFELRSHGDHDITENDFEPLMSPSLKG